MPKTEIPHCRSVPTGTFMNADRAGWPLVALRFGLAASFLVTASSRFSERGWESFMAYTAALTPYLPDSLTLAAGAIAHGLELAFGVALILGFRTRIVAAGSAVLLAVYAVSMVFWDPAGWRAAFWYSVFTAAAGAWALARFGPGPLSLDGLRTRAADEPMSNSAALGLP